MELDDRPHPGANLKPNPSEGSGILPLIAGVFCLSFAAAFVKTSGLGPTAAGLHRMGGAFLVLLLAVLAVRPTLPSRASALWIFIGGLAFACDMAVWNRAIYRLGPGPATLLANLQVFLVPLFGGLLGRPWPPLAFFGAATLAIGGLGLIALPLGDGEWRLDPIGLLQGVAAAASYAMYIVCLEQGSLRGPALHPALSLALVTGAGVVGLGGLQLIESYLHPDAPVLARSTEALLGVLGMVGVVQIGGWTFLLRGIKRAGAAAAGVILVGQSVLAFSWDLLLFGRPVRVLELLGVGLVILGILLGWRATLTVRRQT